uniref:Succinate dehydrogenase [ubiquinone] cytochrome b small subunit n=1 Tax=Syphacia muris TaxID=451379 RepID=A0A0N5A8K2_9BILA
MLSVARRSVPLCVRLAKSPMALRSLASTVVPAPPQYDPIAAQKQFKPLHNHGPLFKIERYFAAAMVPLFPAAYFIHTPLMDTILALALTLHIHWGVWGVVNDYGRPYVLGDTLAKAVRVGAYVMTACLLAGLLVFNQNDIGLTKAFELVWSL